MKIVIITLGMTSASKSKFYNLQDQGLGKAIANFGHTVDIYNFVDGKSNIEVELGNNCNIHYLSSKSIGIHAIHDVKFITKDVDAVICFSDNQILFRHVYNTCRKRNVVCLPYVGVIGSNNNSSIKSKIMNIFINNMKIYTKCKVLAKTPDVANQLQQSGAENVIIAPICLDETNLKKDYYEYSVESLRSELQIEQNEKVLLYIARLQKEKQPLELIDIFNKLYAAKQEYRLIMISSGEMKDEVVYKINKLNLQNKVTLLERVENSQIWKYYRVSEAFINLNFHEIYGMAILEAMYYECPVVAINAPGPAFIIENNISGVLCKSYEEIEQELLHICNKDIGKKAHDRIVNKFTWESTAKKIIDNFV